MLVYICMIYIKLQYAIQEVRITKMIGRKNGECGVRGGRGVGGGLISRKGKKSEYEKKVGQNEREEMIYILYV